MLHAPWGAYSIQRCPDLIHSLYHPPAGPQKNQYCLFSFPQVFFPLSLCHLFHFLISPPLFSCSTGLLLRSCSWLLFIFDVTWLLRKVRSGRTKRGGRFVIVGLLMGTELCCLALQLESPRDTQGSCTLGLAC